ncbi:MAG TPA: hypothetical protein V6C65_04070 [Allocoleopsis sp.]
MKHIPVGTKEPAYLVALLGGVSAPLETVIRDSLGRLWWMIEIDPIEQDETGRITNRESQKIYLIQCKILNGELVGIIPIAEAWIKHDELLTSQEKYWYIDAERITPCRAFVPSKNYPRER